MPPTQLRIPLQPILVEECHAFTLVKLNILKEYNYDIHLDFTELK